MHCEKVSDARGLSAAFLLLVVRVGWMIVFVEYSGDAGFPQTILACWGSDRLCGSTGQHYFGCMFARGVGFHPRLALELLRSWGHPLFGRSVPVSSLGSVVAVEAA